MAGNDVELREMLELLRFTGQGLGLVLKGGKWLANKSEIKKAQLRLAISNHWSASNDKYHMLSHKVLENMCGGEPAMVKIPTEKPEEIAEFCNMLKKRKIAASVMDDLNVGDGFTEIAFNPSQTNLMKSTLDKFNYTIKERYNLSDNVELGREITFDDYYNNAKPEKVDEYIDETVEELKKNNPSLTPDKVEAESEKISNIINIDNIKAKFNSSDYLKMSVPKTALVAETNNSYAIKVPNSYNNETGDFLIMGVNKNDTIIENDKIKIAVPKEKDTLIRYGKGKKGEFKLQNRDLFKNYFNKSKADKSLINGKPLDIGKSKSRLK